MTMNESFDPESGLTQAKISSSHQQRETLLRRCLDGDTTSCAEILSLRSESLVRQAARSNIPLACAKVLFVAGQDSWPSIEQTILEEAAGSGNDAVVRYILRQRPSMILSKEVRYLAIRGGVPVWRELIAHDPRIVDVEIGHFGDALGLAVVENDIALVQFLLDSGADVKKSNSITMPILAFARQEGIDQDIIDLLVSKGAVS